jgi:hypothetical protein
MTHDVQCKVCGDRYITSSSTGWWQLSIDSFGQLMASPRPRLFITVPLPLERADACGQLHALTLTERYLDRGTFEPTHTAAHIAAEETLHP